MPGGFASLDTSFPNLEGQTTEQKLRALTDYLYQLLEQLRYTLHNLGIENMNDEALKEIITMSAKQIDLTGYVTFRALSTQGETTINGENITTGSLRALNVYGCSYFDEDGNAKMELRDFSSQGANIVSLALSNMNILDSQHRPRVVFQTGHDTSGNDINAFIAVNGHRLLEIDEFDGNPNDILADPAGTMRWRHKGDVEFDKKIVLTQGVNYGPSLPANPEVGQLFFVSLS